MLPVYLVLVPAWKKIWPQSNNQTLISMWVPFSDHFKRMLPSLVVNWLIISKRKPTHIVLCSVPPALSSLLQRTLLTSLVSFSGCKNGKKSLNTVNKNKYMLPALLPHCAFRPSSASQWRNFSQLVITNCGSKLSSRVTSLGMTTIIVGKL